MFWILNIAPAAPMTSVPRTVVTGHEASMESIKATILISHVTNTLPNPSASSLDFSKQNSHSHKFKYLCKPTKSALYAVTVPANSK